MKTRYVDGRFYTMQSPGSFVDSVLTENGKIIALNDTTTPCNRTISLKGATVFPGFVDAHLHIAGYGEQLQLLQLNKEQDQRKVLALVAQHFKGEFLYAQGHVNRGLTKLDLDTISKDIPILLRHADYHGATVNSAYLKLMQLPHHPDGILLEQLATQAMQCVPKYRDDQLANNIRLATQKLHAYGITGGHSDDLFYFNGYTRTLAAFQHVSATLPFRFNLLIHYLELDAFLASGVAWGDINRYIQLGAIKLFYDGTLTSQTALMQYPYQKTTNFGERIFQRDVLEKLIKKIRDHRLPIAVHTIGDQALKEVAALCKQFPVQPGLIDRIIHASFADLEIVKTLATLPVCLDIQPQFVSSDLPWGFDLISPKTELIYPWKTYLHHHVKIAGSSDAPVEDPNPLLGMMDAIYRQSKFNHQSYGEHEKLSIYEAIQLYTTFANIPTLKTHERGQIAPGFIADFTALQDDIYRFPERLKATYVTHTIIDDHIVYQK